MKQCISYLLSSRKPTISYEGDLALYPHIVWYPRETGKAKKIHLNKTYSRVRVEQTFVGYVSH
jgi:hypothetical protein